MESKELAAFCKTIRRDIIEMISEAGSGHPGGSLSMVELITAAYLTQMKIDPKRPDNPMRDRFVLSKGHAAPCYYAVLGELGFFGKAEFKTFRQLHSMLQGHPDSKKVPGIDASTGSLGQGVSIAVGMALGAKTAESGVRVYTILGDGELQEGQVWEAFSAASHYQLDNLVVMIDNNGLQIDGTNDQVMSLGNLRARLEAFRLNVVEVTDGNDLEAVTAALELPVVPGMPRCILAHTVKGKGISFMENQVGWHGKAPSPAERDAALLELED